MRSRVATDLRVAVPVAAGPDLVAAEPCGSAGVETAAVCRWGGTLEVEGIERCLDAGGGAARELRMPSEFLVRAAESRDAAVITDFNLRLALETEHLRLDPATVDLGVRRVLEDATLGQYFVAERAGMVVGQCSVTYEWSDWRNGLWWWLQSVYVESSVRGSGVFRALFEEVLARSGGAGALGLRLYVERENRAAQEAYRRLGMERTPYEVYEVMARRA